MAVKDIPHGSNIIGIYPGKYFSTSKEQHFFFISSSLLCIYTYYIIFIKKKTEAIHVHEHCNYKFK